MNAVKTRLLLQRGYNCLHISTRNTEEEKQLKVEFDEALEELQEFEDWAEALIRDQRT